MANPNGAVAGNSQNIPEAHVPRTRSTFPLHQLFPNTHRFGEYIPHYVDDLTKDDNYPVHSSGSVRSYTFKSPLLQNVKRNKDYFLVPMEAILPNNWEKFFVNPIYGDDVPDDVGPTVAGFWSKVRGLMSALSTSLDAIFQDTTTNIQTTLQAFFRYLILGEYFYSNGNLLASLGCHGSSYIIISGDNIDVTYDDYFDLAIQTFIKSIDGWSPGSSGVVTYETSRWFTLNVDTFSYSVNLSGRSESPNIPMISLRHALQLMRDNPAFTITNPATSIANAVSTIKGDLYGDWFDVNSVTFCNYEVPCNLSRLWAYQLCCAHFFSNDHVDFVYSSELYRQLIRSYAIGTGAGSLSNPSFTRNGVTYNYDYLSAKYFDLFISFSISGSTPNSILTNAGSSWTNSILGYFSALFGYRRSLRYLDYFTGSRPVPLAVYTAGTGLNGGVSTDVYVNGSQVSVIDITKSIQAQRFLNSVNRIGHQFEDYLKGIFGGKMPAPDYHNPFYLARTSDTIFGQETENTADNQMSDKIAITTNLRSNSGNYMFDCHSDRPGILIGITSYDIPRVYQHSMDRSFLHQNRFDWFNPFMQYIGDQPIYLQELGINPNAGLSTLKNFSYTLRHMEFKQKFNYCAGGFCNPSTDLDLWIFGAKDSRGSQAFINSDWIRSLNCEFDQFYVSLSGWSLGTYFHFIVADYNSVNASRPMAYSPQILG